MSPKVVFHARIIYVCGRLVHSFVVAFYFFELRSNAIARATASAAANAIASFAVGEGSAWPSTSSGVFSGTDTAVSTAGSTGTQTMATARAVEAKARVVLVAEMVAMASLIVALFVIKQSRDEVARQSFARHCEQQHDQHSDLT